jgi:hypothetical protein
MEATVSAAWPITRPACWASVVTNVRADPTAAAWRAWRTSQVFSDATPQSKLAVSCSAVRAVGSLKRWLTSGVRGASDRVLRA